LKPSKAPFTDFNHFPPPGCNSVYILLTPHTQNGRPVNEHQFRFELPGFLMERGAQIFRERQHTTVKI
jgi:hypothetical protein